MTASSQPNGVSFAKNALRQHILKAALTSAEFRASLEEAAKEIRDAAKPLATEATIESGFERVLYAQLRDIGLRFSPEKEVGVHTKRHVAKGRMDTVGNLSGSVFHSRQSGSNRHPGH